MGKAQDVAGNVDSNRVAAESQPGQVQEGGGAHIPSCRWV